MENNVQLNSQGSARQLSSESDLGTAGTYIVSTDLVIYTTPSTSGPVEVVKTIVIAKGVTLIFQGGKILCKGTRRLRLQGNDTVLTAPIEQIFGDGVEIAGTWRIDKAYPQWFDALAGSVGTKEGKPHDSSFAINKAIQMKGTGEVFLPRGNYYINRPLEVPVGITLCGEPERNLNDTGGHEKDDYVASYIIPYVITDGKLADYFKGNGIVRININSDNTGWKQQYPFNTAKICNLLFKNSCGNSMNKTMDDGSELSVTNTVLIARQVCCLVAGGFTFENVAWVDFPSAIKWLKNQYSDDKHIRGCCFVLWNFQNDQGVARVCADTYPLPAVENANDAHPVDLSSLTLTAKYLIDAHCLGDGLTIINSETENGTVVPSCQDYFKCLYISDCKGGSISDCILNRDVVIRYSSGLTYRNNHMELGAQLRVEDCNMEISQNYIEKGRRPSLVLGTVANGNNPTREGVSTSNIILSGNMFRIYTPPKNSVLYPEGAGKGTERTPIKDICIYDIAISSVFGSPISVKMTENYRFTTSQFESHQATGIMIAKLSRDTRKVGGKEVVEEVLTPFNEFNNYSHFLSVECTILEQFQLVYNRTFNSIPTLSGLEIMSNSQIDNANINYPQKQSNISSKGEGVSSKATDNSSASDIPSLSSPQYKYYAQVIIDRERGIVGKTQPFGYKSDSDYDPSIGNLIELGSMTPGPGFILRLIREKKSDLPKFEWVDIPLISGKFLYDNYYSVNGYVWHFAQSNDPECEIKNSGMLSIEYFNSKARCMSKSGTPSLGTWRYLDEIINFEKATSGHFCYVHSESGTLNWEKV